MIHIVGLAVAGFVIGTSFALGRKIAEDFVIPLAKDATVAYGKFIKECDEYIKKEFE